MSPTQTNPKVVPNQTTPQPSTSYVNNKTTPSEDIQISQILPLPAETQIDSSVAMRINNQDLHKNNLTIIYQNCLKIQITPPRQTWSQKFSSTTLIFENQEHLDKVISSYPPNTFGLNAEYAIKISRPNRNTDSAQFSAKETNLVATGIFPEKDIETISTAMTNIKLDHTRITRIRNSYGLTPLVRISTKNPNTISTLLSDGLRLWGRTYHCEPPKLAKRHIPCRNCHQYLHEKKNCTNSIACFHFGNIETDITYTGQMHCPLYPRDIQLPDEPTYRPFIKKQNIDSPLKPSQMTPPNQPPSLNTINFPSLNSVDSDISIIPNETTNSPKPHTFAQIMTTPQKTDGNDLSTSQQIAKLIDERITIHITRIEKYTDEKMNQAINKLTQFITATTINTTPPSRLENTTATINATAKKTINRKVSVTPYGNNIDVIITPIVQKVQTMIGGAIERALAIPHPHYQVPANIPPTAGQLKS
ncbi:hypothetical protein ANN_04029 [Periplaneta americana]|uniref:Uncharacterized protein n=1 Tax=Periplaneta americana TaxID=6978 RepID=A0ABQ8T903_PERAM|nr:hypothetical protein ANN_04029 [Periplaneta americana]